MSEKNRPDNSEKGNAEKEGKPSEGAQPKATQPPEKGKGGGRETKPAVGATGPKGAEKTEKRAESETPKKPEEPKKPPKPKREGNGVGKGLAIAALVLALAAAGGAGYLWQELQKTRGGMEATDAATADRINQLQSARDQLAARVESQQNSVQQLQQQIQQQTQHARQERDALAQAVRDLRTHLSQDRSQWSLAEAEYLLTIANRSLRLEGNVPTAIAALQSADQILAQMADPAFVPVRGAIAGELQQLQSVTKVDFSGLAARIAGLSASVGELPLPGERRELTAEGGTQPKVVKPESWRDWRGWLSAIGSELRGLVRIRTSKQVGRPLMSPEQEFFLRQNLELKLETARAALLERRQTVYKDALTDADQWVNEYFAADSPKTKAFTNTLSQLSQANLKPQLPDISDSLRLLRQTMDEVARSRQRRSGGATEGGTQ